MYRMKDLSRNKNLRLEVTCSYWFPTASEDMRVEVALSYIWKYNVLLVSWCLRDVQEFGTPCFPPSTHASLFSCHSSASHKRVISRMDGRM